jgi:hypothetical protein
MFRIARGKFQQLILLKRVLTITYRVEPKKFRCEIVNLAYCFLINLYLES